MREVTDALIVLSAGWSYFLNSKMANIRLPVYKPHYCKVCGIEVDWGNICNSCNTKAKRARGKK